MSNNNEVGPYPIITLTHNVSSIDNQIPEDKDDKYLRNPFQTLNRAIHQAIVEEQNINFTPQRRVSPTLNKKAKVIKETNLLKSLQY